MNTYKRCMLLSLLFFSHSTQTFFSWFKSTSSIKPAIPHTRNLVISTSSLLLSYGLARMVKPDDTNRSTKGCILGLCAVASVSALMKSACGEALTRNDILMPLLSLLCSCACNLLSSNTDEHEKKADHYVVDALKEWSVNEIVTTLAFRAGLLV